MLPLCFRLISRPMTLALLVVASILPSIAVAGGDAWEFQVISVENHDQEQQKIILRPTGERNPYLARCLTVTILASYDWRWWHLDRPLTKQEHWQAVGFLRRAQVEGSRVMFGAIGSGFGEVESHSCSFVSRGKSIHDASVYSYYKWP